MPPTMMPLSVSWRISLMEAFEMIVLTSSLSSMIPGTSVIRMSFSAPRPAAISPATVSALMFSAFPSESEATLATTGITPASQRELRSSQFTAVTSPTNPNSSLLMALARISCPSLPQTPTALPPAWSMRATSDLFTRPTNTISTTSMVALSVIRSPEGEKLGAMSSLVSQLLISGPPPCTRMGFNPRHHSSTRSLTTSSLRVSSFIAAPPYFTTTVRPRKSCMKGRASESTRTRSKASLDRRSCSLSSKLGLSSGEAGFPSAKTPSSFM
mmetsp:Transcript_18574/g.25749  ORF Transcript_18574/g.25749 Transcript_18574/m.25749 type:complete len:270 (+) Transcript_18574:281-1090(+)